MVNHGATVDFHSWRRAAAALLVGVLAWQALWLVAAYVATGGREFADDMVAYRAYVEDPLIVLTTRHQNVFGAGVASPLLPIELKLFYTVFEPLGDFLAYRLTMLVHILIAIGIGFGVAFRQFGVPITKRDWLEAAFISAVPVAWVSSVLTVQDDCIAAAWSGLTLAACVCLGPIAGAAVAGLGVFCGKIFLGLAFLGIWIASPGSRWRISAVAALFVAALLAFVLWRDGSLERRPNSGGVCRLYADRHSPTSIAIRRRYGLARYLSGHLLRGHAGVLRLVSSISSCDAVVLQPSTVLGNFCDGLAKQLFRVCLQGSLWL